jgi:uncharacterized protein YbjT (DUF2867 family)
MKLIIFGATGSIGRQLVLQALEFGYLVTSFARKKEKLADISHPNLNVVEGDVLNYNSVLAALPGHSTVLVAIGAGRKGIVRCQGTYNIVKAMESCGIKRLICESTLGAGDSKGNMNFFWRRIMFGWFLKEAYLDHQLQENHIMASSLDWTIVRPAAFTNGKLTGEYKHGFGPDVKSITLKISRPDVALFMLMQVTNDSYLRKTPGLSY